MNILIVGSGGREHALAWKCAQSESASKVFVAPGNAGTALEPNVINIDIAADDISALATFAEESNIGLTIVGPEVPLVNGIVDAFNELNLPCFGPSKAAAQLEGSKAFSKNFLYRHNIPTAAYESFTDIQKAKDYIKKVGAPIVIKADGLAAGKGVILAQTQAQAISAVNDMLAENTFGNAGSRVVIEEFLKGEEASFIVMVDGKNVLPLATSQDHKARDNGDKGPNTGGMGAYSPAAIVTPAMHNRIMNDIINPTVQGLIADGTPYTGFLYAGVMIDESGHPKVLEFNCRFGDPETQPIMMRLQSDLVELCLAAINGELNQHQAQWDKKAALAVVMAAGGYPFDYPTGEPISGLDRELADTKIFHAGTAENNQTIVTSGGRVLCSCALGDSVTAAQKKAYQRLGQISWNGAYYRNDIGHRAISREQQTN